MSQNKIVSPDQPLTIRMDGGCQLQQTQHLREIEQRDVADDAPDEVVFSAQKRIVLECGRSRIILDRSGTIFIEGLNISTEARDLNVVKGNPIMLN